MTTCMTVSPQLDAELEGMLEEGAACHRGLDLPRHAVRAAVLGTLVRRLTRAGMPVEDLALRAALRATARTDLYLALHCDAGCAAAWRILVAQWTPPLAHRARRAGVPPEEAQSLAQQTLGDLWLSPGRARTRLGTYLGTGCLLSFLATLLHRRILRERRRVAAVALDEVALDASAPVCAPVPGLDAHVLAAACSRLQEAWRALAPRQRHVLATITRDRSTQREVASTLGLSESRLCRVLKDALAQLRRAVQQVVPVDELTSADLASLAAAVTDLWCLAPSRAASAPATARMAAGSAA